MFSDSPCMIALDRSRNLALTTANLRQKSAMNLFSSVGNVHKFVKTQSWQGFQTIRFKCATVADSLANPRIGAAYSEKPAIFLKHTLSETNEKAAKHQLVRMTANSDCSTEENRFMAHQLGASRKTHNSLFLRCVRRARCSQLLFSGSTNILT